jgi:hypothetical protein
MHGYPRFNPGAKRTQRSAYTTVATKLGITYEEYMAHFENDERWCSWHRAWESKAIFTPSNKATSGVIGDCRAGSRERVKAREAAKKEQQ